MTRVYATAILVQICALSTSDEKYSEEIHRSVERVIQALLKVPKGTSLRGMTWPICVAGAVASQSQQAFFTDLLGEILERAGTGFTNCGTVLLILKESWKLNDGFSCNRNAVRSAMERLGIRALLV